MISIGIVGTWKNTGKTTVLSFLLNELTKQKKRIAVTGIGYDGEEIDNITNLPKPRLFFERDSIVSTSEKCLLNTDLFFKVLEKTDFKTALGKIDVINTLSSGMVVVAGPNKKSSLQSFFALLEKYGIDILLIDGSLNRIAPLSIADYIIFATGASRSTDINFLAEETKAIEYFFNFPKNNHVIDTNVVNLSNLNNKVNFKFSSVLDEEDAKNISQNFIDGDNYLVIPKLLAENALIYLINNTPQNVKINLTVESPISFLLSGSPINLSTYVKQFINNGNTISFINKPQLAAITVNPFYPKSIDHYFIPEYLDKEYLLNEISKSINTKVFDIKQNPNGILDFINSKKNV